MGKTGPSPPGCGENRAILRCRPRQWVHHNLRPPVCRIPSTPAACGPVCAEPTASAACCRHRQSHAGRPCSPARSIPASNRWLASTGESPKQTRLKDPPKSSGFTDSCAEPNFERNMQRFPFPSLPDGNAPPQITLNSTHDGGCFLFLKERPLLVRTLF